MKPLTFRLYAADTSFNNPGVKHTYPADPPLPKVVFDQNVVGTVAGGTLHGKVTIVSLKSGGVAVADGTCVESLQVEILYEVSWLHSNGNNGSKSQTTIYTYTCTLNHLSCTGSQASQWGWIKDTAIPTPNNVGTITLYPVGTDVTMQSAVAITGGASGSSGGMGPATMNVVCCELPT